MQEEKGNKADKGIKCKRSFLCVIRQQTNVPVSDFFPEIKLLNQIKCSVPGVAVLRDTFHRSWCSVLRNILVVVYGGIGLSF